MAQPTLTLRHDSLASNTDPLYESMMYETPLSNMLENMAKQLLNLTFDRDQRPHAVQIQQPIYEDTPGVN
jgi:hypothetical protein